MPNTRFICDVWDWSVFVCNPACVMCICSLPLWLTETNLVLCCFLTYNVCMCVLEHTHTYTQIPLCFPSPSLNPYLSDMRKIKNFFCKYFDIIISRLCWELRRDEGSACGQRGRRSARPYWRVAEVKLQNGCVLFTWATWSCFSCAETARGLLLFDLSPFSTSRRVDLSREEENHLANNARRSKTKGKKNRHPSTRAVKSRELKFKLSVPLDGDGELQPNSCWSSFSHSVVIRFENVVMVKVQAQHLFHCHQWKSDMINAYKCKGWS